MELSAKCTEGGAIAILQLRLLFLLELRFRLCHIDASINTVTEVMDDRFRFK